LLISGAAFGAVLQRSRFCFFCIFRDFFQQRDSRGLLGILTALALGSAGYLVVVGAWISDPTAGHLPPNAHIGPVNWHLGLGAFAFGLGMALSGSCISAHLYKLGEGSLVAPVALAGAVAGFGLGFASWNFFYLASIAAAPAWWLPAHLGYAGALLAYALALGGLTVWLLRYAAPAAATPHPPAATDLRGVWTAVMINRWPAWVGGVGVGLIGTFVYLRAQPLGVTAELGRAGRWMAERLGLLPSRLEGLDGLAGCASRLAEGWLSDNGIFVAALVVGAWIAALVSGEFQWQRPTLARCAWAFVGGILLGFGAMISLGCTVGTLLSGIMAFAVSGWVFAPAALAGVWCGLRLRRRLPGLTG
jgi:uncharacterized membrane protein YedE/YeeE